MEQQIVGSALRSISKLFLFVKQKKQKSFALQILSVEIDLSA